MSAETFELLRDARHEVAQLATSHRPSIEAFRAAGHDWFKLRFEEEVEDLKVRHRSTTASCLESLDDVGDGRSRADPENRKAADLRDEVAPQFAINALAQSPRSWESEGAAFVYCRVRTLPAILRFAPAEAAKRSKKVGELVDYVWNEVKADEPRRQGIYERPEFDKAAADEKQKPSYPANAFHTFWALRLLQMCAGDDALAEIAMRHAERRQIATLWTQNMLGSQIALYQSRAERADPSQLAWALISQFVNPRQPVEPAVSQFARPDLYSAALDAFFGQQLESGAWPLGQPLFHYPRAGNAYCYTFETLTELLRPALLDVEGAMLRDLLRPHLEGLMKAFRYAKRTAQPLGADGILLGWSSGHHPHRTQPEGWATAAVFSYTQCLRRLLAKWTRDQAVVDLRRSPPRQSSAQTPTEALVKLAERGDTWRSGEEWSVSEQLAALFLHPVTRAGPLLDNPIDPDVPPIAEDQARSAILFGPPGTSKTTVAESLAATIGWEFIEVRASDFLSEGMDRVPARADEIFDRLMELDHCVVLFDEIDELLRERQAAEADPFGRFLTTSMLPKVAELWKQRRVIFFVATNDIAHADRAIKRSQRFDAAIFVPPSSLSVKKALLKEKIGGKKGISLSTHQVEEALKKSADENPLGYFALLRYDQLDELAARLWGTKLTKADLEAALREVGDHLRGSDWHYWPQYGDPEAEDEDPFKAFQRQRKDDQHRDYRMMLLVRVMGEAEVQPPEGTKLEEVDGRMFLRLAPTVGRPPNEVQTSAGAIKPDQLLRYGHGE